jgi:hypothetical protein
MGKVVLTEEAFCRDTQLNRKRKFLYNRSLMNMFHKPVERHTQEGAHHKSKQEDFPVDLNSNPFIYQTLLIPDEECLAEAEVSTSFDIIGSREGFHLFGGDIFIIDVPAKIYLTTYRVISLDLCLSGLHVCS